MSGVTDEAVEAAARAEYEEFDSHFLNLGISYSELKAEDPVCVGIYQENARRALNAAAHIVAAETLRGAAQQVYNGAPDPFQRYYDWGVAQWLYQIAADVELGVSA